MERGVPIRSISRSIAVLQIINRYGALSLMEIARKSNLAYPTTCRIIQTLINEGMVECESTRKFYRATALVHTLSQGFQNQDDLVNTAHPFLVALTRKLGWPVAIATRVGDSMMLRDTTHGLTALTSNIYPPGYTVPLLECASGHLYLADMDEDERMDLFESLAPDAALDGEAPLPSDFERTVMRIRKDGFATYEHGTHPPHGDHAFSVSVPFHRDASLAGALSLVVLASSMAMPEGILRYLPDLQATAAHISDAISAL